MLVIDEDVVIWSPTPRSVEAARKRFDTPNGIVLGRDPATALISAIVPEGTDSVITEAEIGVEVVTPADVQETVEAIKRNPIIPVELAQVTRVFSTKLQFVELEVTNAKMSKMSLSIPRPLLNADAAKEIKLLIDGQLKAFGEFREVAINVPAFTTDGQASFDRDRNRQTARVSEADLEQVRHNIERRFLYPIVGHGMLISRDEKPAFEVVVKALETQLTAYWNGVREDLTAQSGRIIDQAVQLIKARLTTGGQPPTESFLSDVQKTLLASLNRRTTSEPTVRTKYKDVTFEHTQSDEFRDKVQRALPSHVQNQLGAWVKHFKAARQAMS